MDWVKFNAEDTDSWPQFGDRLLLFMSDHEYQLGRAIEGERYDDDSVGLSIEDPFGDKIPTEDILRWVSIEPPKGEA